MHLLLKHDSFRVRGPSGPPKLSAAHARSAHAEHREWLLFGHLYYPRRPRCYWRHVRPRELVPNEDIRNRRMQAIRISMYDPLARFWMEMPKWPIWTCRTCQVVSVSTSRPTLQLRRLTFLWDGDGARSARLVKKTILLKGKSSQSGVQLLGNASSRT